MIINVIWEDDTRTSFNADKVKNDVDGFWIINQSEKIFIKQDAFRYYEMIGD